MLILNLKTFQESSGDNLEKIMEEVADLITSDVYIAPEMSELVVTKKAYPQVNIISQHVDVLTSGASTGWLPPENLLENEINISLYNHSEHRVWDEVILDKIEFLQSKGMRLIVCCQNLDEANILTESGAYAIAYEPPDLIGSGISVTTRPETVKQFIDIIPDGIIPIIGSGVSSGEDIKTALQLGAKGVLVASAFAKAHDHRKKLEELLGAFR